MSFRNIPDDASIHITIEDCINLLLVSVAFEELGLAHIINAAKIQQVLNTEDWFRRIHLLLSKTFGTAASVDQTLRNVIKNQMLLQFKLEDTLYYFDYISTTTTTYNHNREPIDLDRRGPKGSISKAPQALLNIQLWKSDEDNKTVDLVMGATEIDVGSNQNITPFE